MRNHYDVDSIRSFLFEENWLEPPLYHNNLGKTLRFDLIGKPETESYQLVLDFLSDLFINESYMYVIFYCNKHSPLNKRYFRPFAVKKLFKANYLPKTDEEKNEEQPHMIVGLTKRKYFKAEKYFGEYLRGEQASLMAFVSLKKGAVLQFYDQRGFDLFSTDLNFLRMEYSRHSEYIIEYNREEIRKALALEGNLP